MDRRSFLRGLFATTALVAVPAVVQPLGWDVAARANHLWEAATPEQIVADMQYFCTLLEFNANAVVLPRHNWDYLVRRLHVEV